MMYKIVVSQLAKFIRSIDLRKCDDKLVGAVSSEGFRQQCFSYQKFRVSNIPKVIFVLESPHTSEYMNSPLPARQRTGSAIRKYFPAFILEELGGEYELLLVNAVQYQCSLGVNTSAFRDGVFKDAWISFGQVNFEKRLRRYFRDGDIVVNACTQGANKPYLNDLVEGAIRKVIGKNSDFKINHPSSWSRQGVKQY